MITHFDIHKKIVQILTAVFPKVPVLSQDIREGIDIDKRRPCFFVAVNPIHSGVQMVHFTRENVQVTIEYWPPLKNAYNKRLKMTDFLGAVFRTNIHVEDRSLLIQNKSSTQSLEALMFSFDLDYYVNHYGGTGEWPGDIPPGWYDGVDPGVPGTLPPGWEPGDFPPEWEPGDPPPDDWPEMPRPDEDIVGDYSRLEKMYNFLINDIDIKE